MVARVSFLTVGVPLLYHSKAGLGMGGGAGGGDPFPFSDTMGAAHQWTYPTQISVERCRSGACTPQRIKPKQGFFHQSMLDQHLY